MSTMVECRSFCSCTNQAMHAGVIRDMEQQKIKKERMLDFQMQQQLEKEYRKVQTVSDSGGEDGSG